MTLKRVLILFLSFLLTSCNNSMDVLFSSNSESTSDFSANDASNISNCSISSNEPQEENTSTDPYAHNISIMWNYDENRHFRKCYDCQNLFYENNHVFSDYRYDEENNLIKLCKCGFSKTISLFEQDENYYYYRLEDGSLSIRNKNNTISGTINIPESFQNLMISAIAEKGFAFLENVEEIILPKTIRRIEKSAFFYGSFSKINLPEGLLFIGSNSLGMCQMEEINIPKSVQEIEPLAFYDGFNLKAINVDEDNETLKSVDGVVYSKDGRKLLHFPSKKLQNESFSILNGTQIICEYAFSKSLLNEIMLPSSVIEIKPYAFNEARASTIQLNEGLKTIGEMAFSNTPNLLGLSLPSSFTNFEGPALAYAGKASFSLTLENNNQTFILKDGVLYSKDLKTIYGSFNKSNANLVLEEDTECIYPYAFSAKSQITSIEFNNKLRIIGRAAFSQLFNIENITLPDSLESLDSQAFSTCNELKNLIIPQGILRISLGAFDLGTKTKVSYKGTIQDWDKVNIEYEIVSGNLVSTVSCSDGAVDIRDKF